MKHILALVPVLLVLAFVGALIQLASHVAATGAIR